MIVGHGTVARVLTDRADRTYFASGVSNSQETDESAYKREIDLLLKQPTDKRLVYFSSLAIFYEDTRYTQHKRLMEDVVKTRFPSYCIVRLGLATWGTNHHTMINKIKGQIARGEPYAVYPVFRYALDESEFKHWVALIPEWNCELNVTGTRMSAKAIIDKYVLGGL
jgi:hypothetical protein